MGYPILISPRVCHGKPFLCNPFLGRSSFSRARTCPGFTATCSVRMATLFDSAPIDGNIPGARGRFLGKFLFELGAPDGEVITRWQHWTFFCQCVKVTYSLDCDCCLRHWVAASDVATEEVTASENRLCSP